MDKRFIEVIVAFNDVAPDCHKMSHAFRDLLEQTTEPLTTEADRPLSELVAAVQNTVSTLRKKWSWDLVLERESLSASAELFTREPGLLYILLGELDAAPAIERLTHLRECLRNLYEAYGTDFFSSVVTFFLGSSVEPKIWDTFDNLNTYHGAEPNLSNPHAMLEFMEWAVRRVLQDTAKNYIITSATTGSLRNSVFGGIASELEASAPLSDLAPKDRELSDYHSEVISYLLQKAAEDIVTSPAKAKLSTRLYSLAAQHTHLYLQDIAKQKKRFIASWLATTGTYPKDAKKKENET